MDAYHVLFDRPWLFRRRVIHDGYKNTYSFTKNGKKVTFTPILSIPNPKHHSTKEKYHSLIALLKSDYHELIPFREVLLNIDQKEQVINNLDHPLLVL